MARRIIAVGEPTDHGGTVISASAGHTIDSKVIARLGDRVNCPRSCPDGAPHDVDPMVEGEASLSLDVNPVALKSHKTACGCSLIGITSAMHG